MSTREHRPGFVPQAKEGALQVRIEDSIPFLLRQLGDCRHSAFQAGVVHGVIEPSKCLHRVGNHSFDVLCAGNIRYDEARHSSAPLDLAYQPGQFIFSEQLSHSFLTFRSSLVWIGLRQSNTAGRGTPFRFGWKSNRRSSNRLREQRKRRPPHRKSTCLVRIRRRGIKQRFPAGLRWSPSGTQGGN